MDIPFSFSLIYHLSIKDQFSCNFQNTSKQNLHKEITFSLYPLNLSHFMYAWLFLFPNSVLLHWPQNDCLFLYIKLTKPGMKEYQIFVGQVLDSYNHLMKESSFFLGFTTVTTAAAALLLLSSSLLNQLTSKTAFFNLDLFMSQKIELSVL